MTIDDLLLCLMPMWGMAEVNLSAWANPGDSCYHLDQHCDAAVQPQYAISVEAAEAFGRLPCPACATFVPEATPAPSEVSGDPEDMEISYVKRSGTWVFRVPRALLESVEASGGEAPEGTRALVSLVGEGLADVLDARVAVPTDGERFLSLRLIDGDCYVVMRPKHSYKAKRPFTWVAEHIAVDIFNPGVFSVTGISGVREFVPKSQKHDPKRVLDEEYGDVECDVYSGGGMYIAVFHWEGMTDEASLTGVVRIGSEGEDIPVSGYISKHESIFCCALSEAEYQALKDGAEPFIIPKVGFQDILVSAGSGDGGSEAAESNPFMPIATLPADIFANASEG